MKSDRNVAVTAGSEVPAITPLWSDVSHKASKLGPFQTAGLASNLV